MLPAVLRLHGRVRHPEGKGGTGRRAGRQGRGGHRHIGRGRHFQTGHGQPGRTGEGRGRQPCGRKHRRAGKRHGGGKIPTPPRIPRGRHDGRHPRGRPHGRSQPTGGDRLRRPRTCDIYLRERKVN